MATAGQRIKQIRTGIDETNIIGTILSAKTATSVTSEWGPQQDCLWLPWLPLNCQPYHPPVPVILLSFWWQRLAQGLSGRVFLLSGINLYTYDKEDATNRFFSRWHKFMMTMKRMGIYAPTYPLTIFIEIVVHPRWPWLFSDLRFSASNPITPITSNRFEWWRWKCEWPRHGRSMTKADILRSRVVGRVGIPNINSTLIMN